MSSPDELVLIFASAPDEDEASEICGRLLMSNTVAIAYYWPMTSLIKWGLETHSEDEVGMILFTRSSLVDRVIEKAKAMYSKGTPTILVLDIKGGNLPILQYISGHTAHPE